MSLLLGVTGKPLSFMASSRETCVFTLLLSERDFVTQELLS